MTATAKEYVANYFEKINSTLGLSVSRVFRAADSGRFPVFTSANDVVVVPHFFYHSAITDAQRHMMIIRAFSSCYLEETRDPSDLPPILEHLSKGICNALGEEYVPFHKMEKTLRTVRTTIYDDPYDASFFCVGDVVRLDMRTYCEVVDIQKENGSVYVTTKPVGYSNPTSAMPKIWAETELFELTSCHEDCSHSRVDLRKNLFILSAPSATGKNTVYTALKARIPAIERVITVTTRKPRANETDGEDYHFLCKRAFEQNARNGKYAEYNAYDDEYYATPYSEIEKHGVTTPLFLILDTNGMLNVMREYPLSTSVFLKPPSVTELEKRIRARGANTPEEIQRRLEEAKHELQRSTRYDYVITNDDLKACVDELECCVRNVIEAKGLLETR